MIRIAITAAAYETIAATPPFGQGRLPGAKLCRLSPHAARRSANCVSATVLSAK
jgi:hypothetical protein